MIENIDKLSENKSLWNCWDYRYLNRMDSYNDLHKAGTDITHKKFN